VKALGVISGACLIASLGLRTVSAGLYYFPFSVAADSKGNVYVSGKQNKIVKLTPDGVASDFVGNPSGATRHRDGVGTAALLEDGKDLAIDAADNLYIVDNNKVRRITPGAVVTTLAGNDTSAFVDGVGAKASFRNPKYIAVGPDARVYVVDRVENEYAAIRIITPGGVVTTRRNADGSVLEINAYGIAVEPNGDVIESDGARCIHRLLADNSLVTIAGQCGKRPSNPVYTPGDAAASELMEPLHVILSAAGAVYMSDQRLNRIISIANGKVATVAGNNKIDMQHSNVGGYSDPGFLDGPAKLALFNSPEGITFDPAGNLFIADMMNQCIRKLTPSGGVSTFSK
jgi:serine/threonine protein kinase, bacterial